MNNTREVFIDKSCSICSSFGKNIKSQSKNITVTSNEKLDEDLYALDSIIFKSGDKILVGVDAIVELVNEWGGYYKLIKITKIFPKSFNQFIYRFISRNRHTISNFRTSNNL